MLVARAVVGSRMSIMRMMAGTKPPPPAVVSTAKAEYAEVAAVAQRGRHAACGARRGSRARHRRPRHPGQSESGDDVKAGQVLLQLRDSEDVAQLHQLEAPRRSAQSRSIAPSSSSPCRRQQGRLRCRHRRSQGQTGRGPAAAASTSTKKQLRAPFAGRAGIITVNPGAYLNSGTTIVTLQQLDPIFVDFHLPQRNLSELKVGQKVALTLDAFKGKTFDGSVDRDQPRRSTTTRATCRSRRSCRIRTRMLTPGMFVNVNVDVGDKERHLTCRRPRSSTTRTVRPCTLVKTKAEFDKAQAQNAAANNDEQKPASGCEEADKDKADQQRQQRAACGPARRAAGVRHDRSDARRSGCDRQGSR